MFDGNKSITFFPVYHGGQLVGAQYLPFLLKGFECYDAIFQNDEFPSKENAKDFIENILDFLEGLNGWAFVVLDNDKPFGIVWAQNWDGVTVEIGGWAIRKTNPNLTKEAFKQAANVIFANSKALLIRANFAPKNRAVNRLLLSLGFNTPESRRGVYFKDGQPLTSTILSITKQEWESQHGGQ